MPRPRRSSSPGNLQNRERPRSARHRRSITMTLPEANSLNTENISNSHSSNENENDEHLSDTSSTYSLQTLVENIPPNTTTPTIILNPNIRSIRSSGIQREPTVNEKIMDDCILLAHAYFYVCLGNCIRMGFRRLYVGEFRERHILPGKLQVAYMVFVLAFKLKILNEFNKNQNGEQKVEQIPFMTERSSVFFIVTVLSIFAILFTLAEPMIYNE